jgi:hypothetical protein
MKQIVKLNNADRAVGQTVNVAVCERIHDDDGQPLSDGIVGCVDAIITGCGAYWSDTVHGDSGRYYEVECSQQLPHPRTVGATIVLGL